MILSQFYSCSVAHNSYIESYIVTTCNEMVIKVTHLMLDAMFMLPNTNVAVMSSL